MYFNSYQSNIGTVVVLTEKPNPETKELIKNFIENRGGYFTDKETHKEFYIRKKLDSIALEKLLQTFNIPLTYKRDSNSDDFAQAFKALSKDKKRILDFGKFKALSIDLVPESYLHWLVRNTADKELIEDCQKEIESRNYIYIN